MRSDVLYLKTRKQEFVAITIKVTFNYDVTFTVIY